MTSSKLFNSVAKKGGYTKRFNSWIHLVMFHAVIMRFYSLREITTSLLAEMRQFAHLWISFKFGRNTLADANKRHTEAIFKSIYRDLYVTYRHILSLDSRNGKTLKWMKRLQIISSMTNNAVLQSAVQEYWTTSHDRQEGKQHQSPYTPTRTFHPT